MERNVTIITDLDGTKIVLINDIIFKGKRSIDWKNVEKYLRRYVGEAYYVADTKDMIYIGADLPDEYCHSEYTLHLQGMNGKAKANLSQGIPEIIEVAENKIYEENRKDKHNRNAKLGWYRYDSRFALPVYGEDGEIERFNVFRVRVLVRRAANGKMYLYDLTEIKKKRANSVRHFALPDKNPFPFVKILRNLTGFVKGKIRKFLIELISKKTCARIADANIGLS